MWHHTMGSEMICHAALAKEEGPSYCHRSFVIIWTKGVMGGSRATWSNNDAFNGGYGVVVADMSSVDEWFSMNRERIL